MEMKFTLDDIIQSEQGQAIVLSMLREAADNVFRNMMASDVVKSNLCHYFVSHVLHVNIGDLQEQVEKEVREKISSGNALQYFSQNKTLENIVNNAVRSNESLIQDKVVAALSDDARYNDVSYYLGEALLTLIAKARGEQ